MKSTRSLACFCLTYSASSHPLALTSTKSVHVNGLENFWSLLKRGLNGTYVSVEPFHLQAYVDEQSFRYNNRNLTDGERFQSVMAQIVGRRLTYAELTGKSELGPTDSTEEAF
jgi:hypothetical protein